MNADRNNLAADNAERRRSDLKWGFKKRGSITVTSINFLCEQQGHSEDELKQRLSGYFRSEFAISIAFLLRVRYGDSADQHVALCIYSDGVDQKSAQEHISEIFRGMFKSDQSIDIIFLDSHKMQPALHAGKPFYVRKVGPP
jgi:hypothetical protein